MISPYMDRLRQTSCYWDTGTGTLNHVVKRTNQVCLDCSSVLTKNWILEINLYNLHWLKTKMVGTSKTYFSSHDDFMVFFLW